MLKDREYTINGAAALHHGGAQNNIIAMNASAKANLPRFIPTSCIAPLERVSFQSQLLLLRSLVGHECSPGVQSFCGSEAGAIRHIDPKNGKFGPVIVLPPGDIPNGIAGGPDGTVWFTVASYTNPSEIGKIVIH